MNKTWSLEKPDPGGSNRISPHKTNLQLSMSTCLAHLSMLWALEVNMSTIKFIILPWEIVPVLGFPFLVRSTLNAVAHAETWQASPAPPLLHSPHPKDYWVWSDLSLIISRFQPLLHLNGLWSILFHWLCQMLPNGSSWPQIPIPKCCLILALEWLVLVA